MSGQWRVKCVYPDGKTVGYTKNLNLDASSHTIQRGISENCPFMRNRVLVHTNMHKYPFSHHTLGKMFYIDFNSYNDDPGQFEVVSADDNPLIGKITYTKETLVPYNKNLMFYPIPFEMLETYEEKPQMLVEVTDKNGREMSAVCHSMKCSFMHIKAVGEVTSFTYNASTKKLTVTGTGLPNNISKLQSIDFAKSSCKPIPTDTATGALSGTSIECTLARNPTCGSWLPKVTTPLGNIPQGSSVKAQDIPCTISAATPLKDLNLLGKDKITFTGTNFPHEL